MSIFLKLFDPQKINIKHWKSPLEPEKKIISLKTTAFKCLNKKLSRVAQKFFPGILI